MSFFNLGVVSVGKNPFDMVGGFVAGAAKAAADTAGDAVNAAAKAANDAGKVAGHVAGAAGKAAGDAANAAGKAAHDAGKVAEGIAGEVGKAAEGAACAAVGAAEKAGGMAAGAAGVVAKGAAGMAVSGAKAVVDGAQKGIEDLNEFIYKPVFPDEYNSPDYKIPKMIVVKDESSRKGIDVCKGAIGWTDKIGELEALCMYEDWAKTCGLSFMPALSLDTAYYVHPFDSAKYVRVEDYIATMKKDMNAELADVAYCLGAKSCKIERTEKKSRSFHIKGHNKNSGSAPLCVDGVPVQGSLEDREKASFGYADENEWHESFQQTFAGEAKASVPELRWYKDDSSINQLIKTRCSEGMNVSKTYRYEITNTYSACVGIGLAKKLDGALAAIKIGQKGKLQSDLKKDSKMEYVYEVNF